MDRMPVDYAQCAVLAVDDRPFPVNHTRSGIMRRGMTPGVDGFMVEPPALATTAERMDQLLPAG